MPEVMQLTKEQAGERLRQCLREVDAHIKAQQITEAKVKLAEARSLDASNPYLSAFEARITTLETATPPAPQQAQSSTPGAKEIFTRTPNPFAGNI
ncbi:MAG: hypothetical protein EPO24_07485, partial [Bacteroidetes bacterium]